ncbi:MAG: hypothetical protein OHK93_000052 [Ramalina farinacea]|uniref:Helicase ATP-binding domain-containing protein n=1 Tax=Ramalina farinacea TaxID=258253 RepID=A0AA43QE65_9LECA|nr:hypothetical protein [Ramalina farinacea]
MKIQRWLLEASTSAVQSSFALLVNLYGLMRIFDQVGHYLLRCSEYLQAPTDCDRNVFYRNPQSLAGEDQNPLKTLELSHRDLSSQIETISQSTDPSAILETCDILDESEAPAILQTDLYRYLNSFTGEISNYNPDFTQGGILADSMGLGKSLSMLALIAGDWSDSTQDSRQSRKTLLIVPSSLVCTWEDELRTHVRPNTLRWALYRGPSRFQSFENMLNCDVIITTYNVLATEWRNMKRGSKPLFSFQWHRIVLDEDRVHRVEFDFNDHASYNKARDKVIQHLQWGVESAELNAYSNVLAKMNALRQMCNLGAHYRPSSSVEKTREALNGTLQQLFDGMTSSGVAVCSRCGEDLLDSDDDKR